LRTFVEQKPTMLFCLLLCKLKTAASPRTHVRNSVRGWVNLGTIFSKVEKPSLQKQGINQGSKVFPIKFSADQ